jgi:hypothetical protein
MNSDPQRQIQLEDEREEIDTGNLEFLVDRDIKIYRESQKNLDWFEVLRDKWQIKTENLFL